MESNNAFALLNDSLAKTVRSSIESVVRDYLEAEEAADIDARIKILQEQVLR